jgi:organic hydroperoxide reductase OsmC/OhrA
MWSTPRRLSDFLADVGEFRREEDFVAAAADCFADQLFVVADRVGVRGIEKIDAEVKRAEDCGGGFCVVALAVEFAHAHAAESRAGDDCALRAEFYFSNCHEDLDDCGPMRFRFFL